MKTTRITGVRGIFLCSIMVLCCYLMTGCGTKKVDLNKILAEEYQITGVSPYGKIECDEKKVREKIVNAILEAKDGDVFDKKKIEKKVKDFDFRFNPVDDLKIGDTVKITWENVNPNLYEDDHILLAAENREFTIKEKDLPQGELVDPFEGLEVKFGGISGDETEPALILSGEGVIPGLRVDYARDEGDEDDDDDGAIKNGDTVTLEVKEPKGFGGTLIDYCVSQGNKVPDPEKLTKKFTVDGLGKFITSVNEINSDELNLLKAWGQKCLQEEYVSREYEEEYSNIELSYQDVYVGEAGSLYLFYKLDYVDSYGSKHTRYFYVKLEKLYTSGDDGIPMTALTEHAEQQYAAKGDHLADIFDKIRTRDEEIEYYLDEGDNYRWYMIYGDIASEVQRYNLKK